MIEVRRGGNQNYSPSEDGEQDLSGRWYRSLL